MGLLYGRVEEPENRSANMDVLVAMGSSVAYFYSLAPAISLPRAPRLLRDFCGDHHPDQAWENARVQNERREREGRSASSWLFAQNSNPFGKRQRNGRPPVSSPNRKHGSREARRIDPRRRIVLDGESSVDESMLTGNPSRFTSGRATVSPQARSTARDSSSSKQ